MQRYYPEGAWTDSTVKHWLEGKCKPEVDNIMELLHKKVTEMYNKRARVLMDDHPLGLQVNLSTGVANGVLVVREVSDCARLLRRILLNKMEFEIEEKDNCVSLKENISKCVYRVTTGDKFLINAFWNFYLKKF